MEGAYTSNFTYLEGALMTLNLRFQRQVLRWRGLHTEDNPPDPILGLSISDAEIDAVFDSLYAENAGPEADEIDEAPIATLTQLLGISERQHQIRTVAALEAGVPLVLPEMVKLFGLTTHETACLLLAIAPQIDRRYERLCGYLNEDPTARLPTIELALQMYCDTLAQRSIMRLIFDPAAPLRAIRLIEVKEAHPSSSGTLLSNGFVADQRVVDHILGNKTSDFILSDVLEPFDNPYSSLILNKIRNEEIEHLANFFAKAPQPSPIMHLHGIDETLQIILAAYFSHCFPDCLDLLIVDGEKLSKQPNHADLFARIQRESYIQRAAIAITNADHLAEQSPTALRAFLSFVGQQPKYLLSGNPIRPMQIPNMPIISLDVPELDHPARCELWRVVLEEKDLSPQIIEVANRFRLKTNQIISGAQDALASSFAFGKSLDQSALFKSGRLQSSADLHNLAEHIESIHTWDDLILPRKVKEQLLNLANWVRFRHVVFEEWGFAKRVMDGKGNAVLFSGASGTGKTMAAGILARELELDLYRIDLSTVVSKYIGETEKNLSKIFLAAETANSILFFDEADALFGKRSEVKDAHDRYANIEVSYLLQRMESYNGIAILATNFRQNLDSAFTRRMRNVIEFPLPNVTDRERIWHMFLPEQVPQNENVNLSFLARQFALTGGNIKNCVLSAAFAAAAEGSEITMRHLVRSIAKELEKSNQPIANSSFGIYHDLLET